MKFAAGNWDERRNEVVVVVVDAARKHVVAIGRGLAMRSDASSREIMHINVDVGAAESRARLSRNKRVQSEATIGIGA